VGADFEPRGRQATNWQNLDRSMNAYDLADTIERSAKLTFPFEERFMVADSIWLISTSSREILNAARATFQPVSDAWPAADLSVHLQVDLELRNSPRWLQPHFRALDHLYYATYGPGDSLLIDQRARRVIGSFSAAMARDLPYWKRVILPFLLGTASASLGITPLHCACVVKNGHGLLLSGDSGAGKSTLALALSLNGFAYLSDDYTYVSRLRPDLRGWGLPIPLKLLPDAVKFFPRLAALEPVVSQNGELAVEVDPVETFGVNRSLSCDPRWLVFLERTEGSHAVFQPIDSSEAASRLASDLEMLPPCISEQRERQLATINAVVDRQCWVLRHGMAPLSVARELAEFCKS
jgi:hypothetical protein